MNTEALYNGPLSLLDDTTRTRTASRLECRKSQYREDLIEFMREDIMIQGGEWRIRRLASRILLPKTGISSSEVPHKDAIDNLTSL